MSNGTPALASNAKREPSGPPFPITSADNGLSIGPVVGEVVFGQNVGQVGNPAKYLSNREIPTNGFTTKFLGPGAFIITQNNRPDSGQLLQVDAGCRIENGFGGVIDNTSGPLAPLLLLNTNAFTHISGDNAEVFIGPEDVRLRVGSIGDINMEVFGGVIAAKLFQAGNFAIGSVVDNGAKLQVNGTATINGGTASGNALDINGPLNTDRPAGAVSQSSDMQFASVVNAVSALDGNHYWEVSINGILKKVALIL